MLPLSMQEEAEGKNGAADRLENSNHLPPDCPRIFPGNESGWNWEVFGGLCPGDHQSILPGQRVESKLGRAGTRGPGQCAVGQGTGAC